MKSYFIVCTGLFFLLQTSCIKQSSNVELSGSVDMGNKCVPAPNGLISWWTGDGYASDNAGTNTGQILNHVRFVDGMVGKAFAFDGTDDAVRVPNSPSFSITGDFTIDVWVFPTVDVLHASIINKWGDTPTLYQRSFALGVGIGGTVEFPLSDTTHQLDPEFHRYNTVPGVIAFYSWNHIAAVFDHAAGTRRIYVNGKKVGERTDPPFTLSPSSTDIAIGAWLPTPGTIANVFPGLIDELDIFNRALSAQEITALFTAGKAGKCK